MEKISLKFFFAKQLSFHKGQKKYLVQKMSGKTPHRRRMVRNSRNKLCEKLIILISDVEDNG